LKLRTASRLERRLRPGLAAPQIFSQTWRLREEVAMPQPDWEELERRVARLEKLVGVEEAVAPTVVVSPVAVPAPVAAVNPATLLAVTGRALLGLAGGYVLRALSESAVVPPSWAVAAGIAYAAFWLAWAARTPAAHRLEGAVHCATAVLVFCPLLWESTLSFHTLPTWITGCLLVAFVLFGLAESWRKDLLTAGTIVTVAGLATASGLLVATHDLVPFTVALLAIAAGVETLACLEHRLHERWLAAFAADLAVLVTTSMARRVGGLPEGYAAIPHVWVLGTQVALLGIYLASTIVRTLLHRRTLTWFEMAQCGAALLVGVSGGLAGFAPICGLACYVVSFLVIERASGHGRNFYVYSTFGILLVLGGSGMLLAGMATAVVWSALAVSCIWAGTHYGRLTLQMHGGIYLLLGLASSGSLRTAAAFTLGSAHWTAESPEAVWAGLAAAGLCFLVVVRGRSEADSIPLQIFRLVIAGAAAWMLAGALAGGLIAGYHSAAGASFRDGYCATMRTGVLVGISLLLIWAGTRWRIAELSRLTIPTMVLGAYRLMMVDLAQAYKPALILSMLMYGVALITLPRLARAGTAPDATAH